VFPVRYGLDSYILFRRNSVSEGLKQNLCSLRLRVQVMTWILKGQVAMVQLTKSLAGIEALSSVSGGGNRILVISMRYGVTTVVNKGTVFWDMAPCSLVDM
jgi:hypothetical protein